MNLLKSFIHWFTNPFKMDTPVIPEPVIADPVETEMHTEVEKPHIPEETIVIEKKIRLHNSDNTKTVKKKYVKKKSKNKDK